MRLAEFFFGVNPTVSQIYNGAKVKLCHFPDLPRGVFLLIAALLIGLGGFFLERILSMEVSRKAELQIVQNSVTANSGRVGDFATPPSIRGMYVAAKTGTAYYAPWCGAVKRILDENKVWFASKADAEERGYKPAENCQGI